MPAIQEIMSILTASIKKLLLVQWKLISGFANSIPPFVIQSEIENDLQ